MVETIDYSSEDIDFSEMMKKECSRQGVERKDLTNVKVKVKCKGCGKIYEKWVLDPRLLKMVCSDECNRKVILDDIFDSNSSRIQYECVVCGFLFNEDQKDPNISIEDMEVKKDTIVCSEKCRKSYLETQKE